MTPLETLREAMQLAHAGRADDAIARLSDCLKGVSRGFSKHDLALLARNAGLLCDHASRLQECIEYYERALRLEPGDAHTLLALGDVYARTGDSSRASRYWKLFEKAATRTQSPDTQELLERYRSRQRRT